MPSLWGQSSWRRGRALRETIRPVVAGWVGVTTPGSGQADHPAFDFVGREFRQDFLARQRARLFSDEEFAPLSILGNNRPSVLLRCRSVAAVVRPPGARQSQPQVERTCP